MVSGRGLLKQAATHKALADVRSQPMPRTNDSTPTTLDADLVWGGLWEGAPVIDSAGTHGVALREGADSETGCWFGWYDTEPEGRVSLRLPGPRGCGLHVLTEAIKERVGIDSKGKLWPGSAGSTWRTAEDIAKACRSGDEYRIAQASKHLVMTDALAAELGWPTGKGAPVWSWTKSGMRNKVWWKLSARASSTESWTHEFSCDLKDPMAALEDVWRRRGER